MDEFLSYLNVLKTGYDKPVYIEFRASEKKPFKFMDFKFRESKQPFMTSFKYAIKLIGGSTLPYEYNIRDFETHKIIYDCAY